MSSPKRTPMTPVATIPRKRRRPRGILAAGGGNSSVITIPSIAKRVVNASAGGRRYLETSFQMPAASQVRSATDPRLIRAAGLASHGRELARRPRVVLLVSLIQRSFHLLVDSWLTHREFKVKTPHPELLVGSNASLTMNAELTRQHHLPRVMDRRTSEPGKLQNDMPHPILAQPFSAPGQPGI